LSAINKQTRNRQDDHSALSIYGTLSEGQKIKETVTQGRAKQYAETHRAMVKERSRSKKKFYDVDAVEKGAAAIP